MSEEEKPLSGGNVNPNVVRVRDTVRRALTVASPTVHEFLLHLERKGFSGCPRFLGIDDQQREILSFIDGETGVPAYLWRDDKALIVTAKLLKTYHDATQDFAKNTSMKWGIVYPDSSRHEVICHNDFAPYNFIYRDQLPYAVIDFDLIGPGPRLRDIAYSAYWLTPLSFGSDDLVAQSEADIKNSSRRLRLFCETYGINANDELLDMVFEVLNFMGDKEQVEKVIGTKATEKLDAEGHLLHWRKEAKSFYENRPRLEANL